METIKPNEIVILECTKFLSNIKTKRFLVAFSGGCDSSVLLHSMNSLRESNKIEIRSVHINHHYTDSSDLYEKHCSLIAKKYNLEHTTKDIYLDSQTNIEHELREKRYKSIIDVADIDGDNENDLINLRKNFIVINENWKTITKYREI